MAKRHKFNPDCADCVKQKREADRLRAKADKAAVRIVGWVADAVENDGTLPAYEGIEVARKIREHLIKTFKS